VADITVLAPESRTSVAWVLIVVLRSLVGCARDDCAEPALHVGGDRRQLLVVDDREHPFGVDGRDLRLTVAPVDDDVAGQEHAEVRFGLERLVCERRVARAEDRVRVPVDAELLFQRRLHVDLAEDAEALGL